MLINPSSKYRAFKPVAIEGRTWPDQIIQTAPVWCSSDLRDGNQALIEPMNVERKRRMFDLLIDLGFKEIEVAFPAASQTDFDFVRYLIEADRIPEDVTIQVLTQAREDLIKRSFESLAGAKNAIMHFYTATSPVFRDVVFNKSRAEMVDLACESATLIKELAGQYSDTDWRFEFSPETFSGTELEFAVEICNAVTKVWQPTPERKTIINLPATVEMSTPNIYADQIEWMHRNLQCRDAIVLSVHPHNDRGAGVAAAELAQMAGAERVEGCLFGNGERTGNVDLATLALNLYTQGIDPGLDFSDIDRVRRDVEHCNQLPVHPRHPYVGDLVHTAFSGSHQDAIKKGFAARVDNTPWDLPYLPIDPADLGRSYEEVIRVNSQSGKGGISFLLEREYGLSLPRRLQIEFSRVVQQHTDSHGLEMTGKELFKVFASEYLDTGKPIQLLHHHIDGDSHRAEAVRLSVDMLVDGQPVTRRGEGAGPVKAFVDALDLPLTLLDYHEHAIGAGADATAAAYVELRVTDDEPVYGVGMDDNIVTASLKAIVSALNRADGVVFEDRSVRQSA
ncbi:MAG: 2-isopropylmalate synthase [marine bacterium B5-7]|nr:MAG: 2-isopropylmalate synthase [marine bacterium B5-7]